MQRGAEVDVIDWGDERTAPMRRSFAQQTCAGSVPVPPNASEPDAKRRRARKVEFLARYCLPIFILPRGVFGGVFGWVGCVPGIGPIAGLRGVFGCSGRSGWGSGAGLPGRE
jgi:hypothetical protein